jgi:hypothetical protein
LAAGNEDQKMTINDMADDSQRALLAFERDLPQLWLVRPGQWVAYQADKQIGFAAKKHELYQRCFDLGLQREQFVVFCIEPQETEITLGPVILE